MDIGAVEVPQLIVTPATVNFGNQTVHVTSAAQTITVSNQTGVAIAITTLSLTGTNASDFAQTTTCGASVPAFTNCAISVTFTPAVLGARTATVTVNTATVTLNGVGVPPPSDTLTPGSLTFAAQQLFTTSGAQSLTLTNTGASNLPFTITITGTNANAFSETGCFGGNLNAGAPCTISVRFTPRTLGANTATLTVNSAAGAKTVTLSGTGAQQSFRLSPASLTFSGPLGVISASQAVTVTNTSVLPLQFSAFASITISGTNRTAFSQSGTCGATLAVNSSCTINVSYRASALGTQRATLNVSGQPGTQSVQLTGTGVAAALLNTVKPIAASKAKTN